MCGPLLCGESVLDGRFMEVNTSELEDSVKSYSTFDVQTLT